MLFIPQYRYMSWDSIPSLAYYVERRMRLINSKYKHRNHSTGRYICSVFMIWSTGARPEVNGGN